MTVPMDFATFLTEWFKTFASLLSAWAWPLVFMAFFVFFKGELRALIRRVKSFKGIGVEAAFEKGLEELEDTPRPVVEDVTNGPSGLPMPQGTTEQTSVHEPPHQSDEARSYSSREVVHSTWVDFSDSSATQRDSATGLIVRTWRAVENAMVDFLVNLAGMDASHLDFKKPSDIIKQLRATNLLPFEFFQRIDQLRLLRNIAAHGESLRLSPAQIDRYAEEAEYVIDTLKKLERKHSRRP